MFIVLPKKKKKKKKKRPSTYGGIETVLFKNSSYRGFGEALYAGH